MLTVWQVAKMMTIMRMSGSKFSFLEIVFKPQGRQEWPIDVDDSSPFRPLADSINLRMARIMALLACGAAPIDAAPKHGRYGIVFMVMCDLS